jgi:hypothetical protein
MVVAYETHLAPRASQYPPPTAYAVDVLAQFDPIGLAEMENVALLDRIDIKYLMGVSRLRHVLTEIVDQYWVLEINGKRLNHYQTLYFDTRDFALYEQHHNGLRSRYKVRIREYVDSELAFWEVKRKTNRGRTVKARRQTQELKKRIAGQVDEFVDSHTPFGANELEPKLWNEFVRITLVSMHRPERLTLDLNLEFGWEDAYAALPGIVIAEVKQERPSQQSDFIQQMRTQGIRPTPFSKYCAGVYMLYDGVKTNNFKSRIRLVEKLIQEEGMHEYVF